MLNGMPNSNFIPIVMEKDNFVQWKAASSRHYGPLQEINTYRQFSFVAEDHNGERVVRVLVSTEGTDNLEDENVRDVTGKH